MSGIEIKEKVPLSSLTTLKVGGSAEYFVAAALEVELREAVSWAKERGLSVRVLGGGSNLLISDQGVSGLVIKNEIGGIAYENDGSSSVLVTAGAGVVFDDLIQDNVERGYWGLENLSSIPGSVGATVVQNVGAYGVEVGRLIESVRVYDMSKSVFVDLDAAACRFGYRDSFFKTEIGRQYVIVGVTFRLSLVPQPRLEYRDLAQRFAESEHLLQSEIRQAVISIRSQKFPDWTQVGTAGSFFKNPIVDRQEYERLLIEYSELPGFAEADGRVKLSLGWILDHVCSLRGHHEGHVGLYDKQALVLVNLGGATAQEIENFAQKIAQKVFEKTNITIEWEVSYWRS